MHAVIISGGKQHKVAEGQRLKLEKLPNEVGDSIAFDQVLLLTDGENVTLGAPYIKGAKVSAEVISQGRHKKINIIKMRRRKHYMRRQGHRQDFTEVKITGITG
ncbi:MAG TPA: 50S ribosomal protein L21 [Gammaproteobacteria bacterium]|nr:50S ribosomal protein L21 [Gammaproteobacteria bacterium]